MSVSRVILVGLPLAAGALAWWLLVRADASAPSPLGRGDRAVDREGTTVTPPPPAITAAPRPDAVPSEPEDPEWITRPLALPPGDGPLKGSELIRAVEAGGKVRFEGATAADLDALRRAVFEDVDRSAPQPHAAMKGWLKDAGFEVEVAYPRLIVRRRTDEDWTGR